LSGGRPDVHIVTTFGTTGFVPWDSNRIISGDRSVEKLILRGAEPGYTEAIPLFNIERGRFISTFDQEHARPWCLGAAISESLFPNIDALGTCALMAASTEVIACRTRGRVLWDLVRDHLPRHPLALRAAIGR